MSTCVSNKQIYILVLVFPGTTMVAHLTCSLLSKKSDAKTDGSLCRVQSQSSSNEKRLDLIIDYEFMCLKTKCMNYVATTVLVFAVERVSTHVVFASA